MIPNNFESASYSSFFPLKAISPDIRTKTCYFRFKIFCVSITSIMAEIFCSILDLFFKERWISPKFTKRILSIFPPNNKHSTKILECTLLNKIQRTLHGQASVIRSSLSRSVIAPRITVLLCTSPFPLLNDCCNLLFHFQSTLPLLSR